MYSVYNKHLNVMVYFIKNISWLSLCWNTLFNRH